MTQLVWFRKDLRLDDNPALSEAAKVGPVLCLYILDKTDEARAEGGASKWWLDKSLKKLDESLRLHGLRLVLKSGCAREVLEEVCRECEITHVYWNRLYDPAYQQRDTQIKAQLKALGISVQSFAASLLKEPWQLKTQSGTDFKVFTPFWKALRVQEIRNPMRFSGAKPASRQMQSEDISDWGLHPAKPDWSKGFVPIWQPGEVGAKTKLSGFLDCGLKGYASDRDIPDADATSKLSPHLAFGEISPNQIWHSTMQAIAESPGLENDGLKFLSELAWRDFSYHILHHRPDLARQNWRNQFDAFPWGETNGNLKAWQKGMTGYPIVDAGMRELWVTGYMHNRVRMIAASFLIKHLLIDWREGEKWFWDTLVDADPANNPASWQWVAGSGADASPYFRIFNPITQGEKFDAQGHYTRKWVPELAKLPDKYLFKPWEAPVAALEKAGVKLGDNYPEPLVDHKAARARALEAYEAIKR